jgi:hypothetical protein
MQHCNRCNRTFFQPGDEVLLSASGHGKIENEMVDQCNQDLGSAICTVLMVQGKEVSLRSENGEEKTVPHAWLISARDPKTGQLRRMHHG